jgi:hypothetical protein
MSNLTSVTIRPVKSGVGWRKLYTPTTSELAQLDQLLATYGLDSEGDFLSGPLTALGTWSTAAAPSGLVGLIGSGIQARTAGGSIILGDNDYPTYSPARTRSVVIPCAEACFSDALDGWSVDSNSLGLFQDPYAAGASIFVPLTKIHNGATISSVTLYFFSPSAVSVPSQYPSFSISRQQISTNTSTALGFATFGGPYVPGTVQSLTISSLSSNVVDTSTYRYFFQINDDNNNVAGPLKTRFTGIRVNYTAIADRRFSQ